MTLKAERWKNLLGDAGLFITDFERRWKNGEIFVANRAAVHSDFGESLKKLCGETRACS